MYIVCKLANNNSMEYCIINNSVQDIIQHTLVKDAKIVKGKNSVLVAVITEAIFTRSDREKLMREIALKYKDDYAKVIVSLDAEVYYYALTNSKSYDEISQIASNRTNTYVLSKD